MNYDKYHEMLIEHPDMAFAAINQIFFNGELPAIRITYDSDYVSAYDALGLFDKNGSRNGEIVLGIPSEVYGRKLDKKDEAEKIATIIAHEMLHLYCYENGIYDTDTITDEHKPDFAKAAKDHDLLWDEWDESYLENECVLIKDYDDCNYHEVIYKAMIQLEEVYCNMRKSLSTFKKEYEDRQAAEYEKMIQFHKEHGTGLFDENEESED